jgi:hypothetical protein
MMAVLHPKGGGGGTLEEIAVSASFRATAMASASRAATEAFFLRGEARCCARGREPQQRSWRPGGYCWCS